MDEGVSHGYRKKCDLKIIDEEKVFATSNSPFFSMENFCDTSTHLIDKHQDEPWRGYKDSTEDDLLTCTYTVHIVGCSAGGLGWILLCVVLV